jgi:hypothetical protein
VLCYLWCSCGSDFFIFACGVCSEEACLHHKGHRDAKQRHLFAYSLLLTSQNVPHDRFLAYRFRILDECDEMLNMGFADSVESILSAAKDSSDVQTLLFSATIPSWVKKIQKQYLKPQSVYIDLVGEDGVKASASVRHKVLYCHWSQRVSIIQDLVKCYGFSGMYLLNVYDEVMHSFW